MVSSTPRPHLTPGKDPVPILQEAWWAPGPLWTGGKSRPYRDFFYFDTSDHTSCSISAHIYICRGLFPSNFLRGTLTIVSAGSWRECSYYDTLFISSITPILRCVFLLLQSLLNMAYLELRGTYRHFWTYFSAGTFSILIFS